MVKESYVDVEYSSFSKSLAFQREQFKLAKSGMEEINFNLMCDSLENMKADLKAKAKERGLDKYILRVEKIINWYRTKEKRYITATPNGKVLQYPDDFEYIANRVLTMGYEIIVELSNKLDLL